MKKFIYATTTNNMNYLRAQAVLNNKNTKHWIEMGVVQGFMPLEIPKEYCKNTNLKKLVSYYKTEGHKFNATINDVLCENDEFAIKLLGKTHLTEEKAAKIVKKAIKRGVVFEPYFPQ